jgi:DNA repair exonuclease SbcCD ATPase subunit
MKIIKFTAENVKRIKAVEISPAGNIVKITGKNGAGKSSVLDAIAMALSGKLAASPSALRKSAKKGKVVLDLGDFTITRSFTEGANYLKVETKDGFERKSPQKFLDEIVGAISFDPMAFINADPKKQRQLLLDFTGLELDKLDQDRADLYASRTLESRYLRDAEGTLKTLEHFPDAPKEAVSVSELLKKLDLARDHNSRAATLKEHLAAAEREHKDNLSKIEEHEREIAILKQADREAVETMSTLEKEIKTMKPVDTKPLEAKIASADDVNNQVRDNQAYFEREDAVRIHKKKVDALTKKIDDIDRQKSEAVEKSKLPVKGLSFTEDAVLFNGVELEHIATSEKIKVGLAISMALNPKLKVLRISDGSLLDSDSWKQITRLVNKNDYQIWVEQVDETGKLGIYLEDGSIKE